MRPRIDLDKLRKLWTAGLEIEAICQRLGCTRAGLFSAAYRLGLPSRRRQEVRQ